MNKKDKIEIKLHTIATMNGKEYELEDVCNGLYKMLNEKDKKINKAIHQLDNLKFILSHKKLLCKCLTEIQDILRGEE